MIRWLLNLVLGGEVDNVLGRRGRRRLDLIRLALVITMPATVLAIYQQRAVAVIEPMMRSITRSITDMKPPLPTTTTAATTPTSAP